MLVPKPNQYNINTMTDVEIARRLVNKKKNAAKRGIHFDLSFKRMKQMCLQKTCFYTGVPFKGIANDIGQDLGDPKLPYEPHAMSIDRVDSSIGYVDDNVVACTWEINNLKANISPKMFKQILSGIIKVLERNKAKVQPAKTRAMRPSKLKVAS